MGRYKGEAKPARNSRCYLQFEAVENAENFIKDYHGHEFVDGRGERYRAVACYAPCQKVPRQKVQKDPREGTIEDDPVYKEFVESMSQPKKFEAPEDPKSLKPSDPTDTPLLQHLKKTFKERRERAEKRQRERERKKWSGYMDQIQEEPKRSKWRCSECGTSKRLEEDPDDRGTFYCTPCWEFYEHEAAAAGTKKKKKKKAEKEKKEYEDYGDYGETEYYTSSKKKKKKRDKEEEEDWWSTSRRKDTVEEDTGGRKK